MKQWLGALILVGMAAVGASAADKGLKIEMVDNKLSIDAEAVSLSRLLRLLDLATGMKSRVVPELANRNISVKFSGLDINDGVRKMFQGQPLDYLVIPGQGIVVTAASQTISAGDSAPVYSAPPPVDQPFFPDFNNPPTPPPGMPGMQQQPAMIQTPFGPIANPRAGQPVAPNAPLSGPGQQNSLFPGSNPFQQQQQQQQQVQPMIPGQTFPGMAPGNPPFGAPSSFGPPGVPGTPPTNTNPFNPSPLFSNPAPNNNPGAPQR
jgi:hypothetical protein